MTRNYRNKCWTSTRKNEASNKFFCVEALEDAKPKETRPKEAKSLPSKQSNIKYGVENRAKKPQNTDKASSSSKSQEANKRLQFTHFKGFEVTVVPCDFDEEPRTYSLDTNRFKNNLSYFFRSNPPVVKDIFKCTSPDIANHFALFKKEIPDQPELNIQNKGFQVFFEKSRGEYLPKNRNAKLLNKLFDRTFYGTVVIAMYTPDPNFKFHDFTPKQLEDLNKAHQVGVEVDYLDFTNYVEPGLNSEPKKQVEPLKPFSSETFKNLRSHSQKNAFDKKFFEELQPVKPSSLENSVGPSNSMPESPLESSQQTEESDQKSLHAAQQEGEDGCSPTPDTVTLEVAQEEPKQVPNKDEEEPTKKPVVKTPEEILKPGLFNFEAELGDALSSELFSFNYTNGFLGGCDEGLKAIVGDISNIWDQF